jgi:hypothetical protein
MANDITVGQRFLQLISHLGISKNAFAASLDKTATVIQHLVDERNKPGFDLLCKVFEVYPNVSKEWLLQGVGPMLQDGSAEASVSVGHSDANPAVPFAAEESQAVATVAPDPPLTTPAPPAATAKEITDAPVAVAEPQNHPAPAPTVSAPADVAPATVAATPVASDASWQTALYTQQMAHQLALAELRNQHLQDQQRLMQQMMDLMQRQLTR